MYKDVIVTAMPFTIIQINEFFVISSSFLMSYKIRKTRLYNLFCRFGKIRDIYIPNKRSKISGKRFCFVKFESREEAMHVVSMIDGTWVWDQKLVVEVARFMKKIARDQDRNSDRSQGTQQMQLNQRNTERGIVPFQLNPRNQRINQQAEGFKGHNNPRNNTNQSFNTAIHGRSHNDHSKKERGKEIWRWKDQAEASKQGEGNPIQDNHGVVNSIHLQPVGNGWLERSAVGKMRRLISAQDLEEAFKKEGVEVQIKPMGGRFLILTFANGVVRDKVIKLEWPLLWLEELKPWNGESAQEERFAWVSCFGMPLNVWNVPSFRRIASIWGHFIEVDDNTLREVSFEKGRFLIATEKSCKIEGKVQLIVEGKRFMVSVEEEESFRIVSSSKQVSSPGSEVSKPTEEDDDVDSTSDDKVANGTKNNVSEKDNSAIERNKGIKE
ncbi:uncharacterized protein LOC131317507 [Rhododendron vialii]|uniref:uncharacterized protein LOC131317507 n=1 Tax=Rhododendron vialii TaxID=182163 RepID=UPI00265FB146|nr:uncharacterized protein LOC131317507 [Rhododendron vialii]